MNELELQSRNGYFICDTCKYKTRRRADFKRHVLSPRHIERLIPSKKQKDYYQCQCGRRYKHMSGLSRHRLVCDMDDPYLFCDGEHSMNLSSLSNDVANTNKNEIAISIIGDLIDYATVGKSNEKSLCQVDNDNKTIDNASTNQLLYELINQLKDLKTLAPNINRITNNNNINIVNLNVFLNEQCKDAISIGDFIHQMEFMFDDLDDTSWRSKVLLNNLVSLQLENRPFHCLDPNTCHVVLKNGSKWQEGGKDDIVWTLDNCGKQVQRTFGTKWESENPNWISSEYKNAKYMRLWKNITSEPTKEQVEKDLRVISKETALPKDAVVKH